MPHTWNADDVMDDEPGYHRNLCWYRKTFTLSPSDAKKEISFLFEGANQETLVLINGKIAGKHSGGYTAFHVPASRFLKAGTNLIMVGVDNSHNENIPPLSADFSFYGGIYRDVYLVTSNRIHFHDSLYGSTGVQLSTPEVNHGKARIEVKNFVVNRNNRDVHIDMLTTILDSKGKKVAGVKTRTLIKAFSDTIVIQHTEVLNPALWSPGKPELYTANISIQDEKGKLLDKQVHKTGFRWFSFDADKGFFLNGKSLKLVGASRHQDFKGMGNAVPDNVAIADLVLLKNMGANFLRVAHYPQDPSILRACDSLGLLASVEIPIVNQITESEAFYNNSLHMQTEMIRQNYNHPSVVMWCYMNEVLLRPRFADDKQRQQIYFENIRKLARQLEELTRKEDPYRYTMMANHGSLSQYKNAGLLEIPMVVGWNLYSGWYGGKIEDFPVFLDNFHKSYPHIPVVVSEYGSDADPRINSLEPVRFDKSIEYTTKFHQYYFRQMQERSFVAGAMIWNLADFHSETRGETMPHINNKGLLQWDRKPKDPYYYYKAILSETPYIKILGDPSSIAVSKDSSNGGWYRMIQVVSNLGDVRVNGKPIQMKDGLGEFRLGLSEDRNLVVASGKINEKNHSDTMMVIFNSKRITEFDELNILLGANRYFVDAKGRRWQPDQPYVKGGWGSIGGNVFKLENNNRLPYGTDRDIIETDDDPIYQTQKTGIKGYRFDAPAGEYELVLHFAALSGGKIEVPVYNLGEEERKEKELRNVFHARLNGKPFLTDFDPAVSGIAKPVTRSTTIRINKGESILLEFEAVEGQPVLNAIRLKKTYAEK